MRAHRAHMTRHATRRNLHRRHSSFAEGHGRGAASVPVRGAGSAATYRQGRAIKASAVRIALQYLGSRNPTHTRGPWCGDFMNLIEHRAGRAGIPSRRAADWRHYGHGSAPTPGAIAVFRGHVGRVVQRIGDKVQIVSGNYSHRVGLGFFNVRSAIAYRMP